MNINKWAEEIHKNAVEHGWWDEPRSFGEVVALCHSELSEALEADRAGEPLAWRESKCSIAEYVECDYLCGGMCKAGKAYDCVYCTDGKPEGVAVEMIDCMIRILDWCGAEGVNVDALLALKHEYNKSRPYKHGKKY